MYFLQRDNASFYTRMSSLYAVVHEPKLRVTHERILFLFVSPQLLWFESTKFHFPFSILVLLSFHGRVGKYQSRKEEKKTYNDFFFIIIQTKNLSREKTDILRSPNKRIFGHRKREIMIREDFMQRTERIDGILAHVIILIFKESSVNSENCSRACDWFSSVINFDNSRAEFILSRDIKFLFESIKSSKCTHLYAGFYKSFLIPNCPEFKKTNSEKIYRWTLSAENRARLIIIEKHICTCEYVLKIKSRNEEMDQK